MVVSLRRTQKCKIPTVDGELKTLLSAHVGFVFGVDVAVDVSAAGAADGHGLTDQHPAQRHHVHLQNHGEHVWASAPLLL